MLPFFNMKKDKHTIYLDFAATTPVDSAVFRAMRPYFDTKFGNPGSLHSFGQEAIAAVDKSRETIASAIERPLAGGFREVIFTGSATEANNLALRGIVRYSSLDVRGKNTLYPSSNLESQTSNFIPRIIISVIEHESIAETAHILAREGLVEVVEVPVDRNGIVDLRKLKASLNDRTVLVSVMYVNNETGVVQPISEIGKIIHDFRDARNVLAVQDVLNVNIKQAKRLNERERRTSEAVERYNVYPLFHTDAAQAFQTLPCDVNELGVDLMTLSAHKIYGPKGVGALYMKRAERREKRGKINEFQNLSSFSSLLAPLVTGGGQEFDLRSGTENVPLIVGFAKAVELADKNRIRIVRKLSELRRYTIKSLKKFDSRIIIHGEESSTAPHIVNFFFPKKTAEEVLTYLDLHGIAASSGSACKARSFEPSRMIRALGFSDSHARHSIRLSFGKTTQKTEIDKVMDVMKALLQKT